MNIDYRLDLALNALDRALTKDVELRAAIGHVEDAQKILREIKADLHTAPDPRQLPLR